MNELLQKLLEAEVLSEDTKTELEAAFQTKIDEAVELASDNARTDVRAELTEQWIQERNSLIEAVDAKVDEFMNIEMNELKEDIERFRDLEAEYADKLVEAKSEMSTELKGDLSQLVEKVDAFLEIRLNVELDEFKDDIAEIKKDSFGRHIFEGFVKEYAANYNDSDSVEGTLRETESRLEDTSVALAEAEAKLETMERKDKLNEVLTPLTGRSHEVMEAILRNVPTNQLTEGYNTFIGRVLKETANTSDSEKEVEVLAESESKSGDIIESAIVLTGDDSDALMEEQKDNSQQLSEDSKARLRKLAGI